MCGRYYIEIDENELKEIISEVEKNQNNSYEQISLKTSGEIYPTNVVPVQVGPCEYLPMKWGFTSFDGKPMINARSETAFDKPMFRESMINRRCVIPASGYYEWQKMDSKRIKYQFYIPNKLLYLAGCWRQEKNNPVGSFVILTKSAAPDISYIHDRMPVILPYDYVNTWFDEYANIMDRSITNLCVKEAS